MKIQNRRYTGSKYKLMPWIKKLILKYCTEHDSLFDVFGGTGVVTASLLDITKKCIINDFLYSNKVIYEAFFNQEEFDLEKLNSFVNKYTLVDISLLEDNYVSLNYGDKYFRYDDAKLIGYIREDIELAFASSVINRHEYCILLTSLLYSFDRCANTVGHYEAYIRGKEIRSHFVFELIEPIKTNNTISIYREDSNQLAKKIIADIAFIDPPYNSRQYSRFYHVMETIVKWDKPILSGIAMKPPEENMSGYCKNTAPELFEDLISNLKVKYIIVTYNNTYDSKSSSSRNKITLEQIKTILEKRGKTLVFETDYHRFNAGKTNAPEHKEMVFITLVDVFKDNKIEKPIRSPFFYVGDKYKIMPQLLKLFPSDISTYVEPFAGGGSSFLNTQAKYYLINDIDKYVIELHKCLSGYADCPEAFLSKLYRIIDEYGFSCSFRGINVPVELKKQFMKTYYSQFNKTAYIRLKEKFNEQQDMVILYLLLVYGFNHMIRFNASGDFNLPVGNVDFNKNVYNAILSYMSFMRNNQIEFYNLDFITFLQLVESRLDSKSFIYLDPPYLISGSEYNKYWNEKEEKRLCDYLDELNSRGIKFGITNLIYHKGKVNQTFLEWAKKYFVYSVSSNYISFNDNTIKKSSKEVYVTNYGKEKI